MSPLEACLALEPDGPLRWRGGTGASSGHVYGGQVVAQALRAAHLTVEAPCWPHSLHASFLQAGTAGEPLLHAVERTRDGSSFATRRVVVSQPGTAEPILVLVASFHVPEAGVNYALVAPSGLPAPESLPPGRYDGEVFDCRDVPPGPARAAGTAGVAAHARRMWFRARGELADDPALHLQGLAFASDHGPTRSVRQPHADHLGVERRMSVSLDHAVWFHRPVRVDTWLLSELVPQSTGAARGLTVGQVWSAEGAHVATVAQEALLRLPLPPG
ncbi:MAG: acyl-CoA thioesterase II [Acidimicrobiia bacterium]|nr:acyl-CoA thioesterase II [Acidimicrobiia bacterium]